MCYNADRKTTKLWILTMLTIIWVIIKILLYGYGGFCYLFLIGRYTGQIIHRFSKKKMSNAAKRELKAEYFEKCGDLINIIGTEGWGDADAFFEEIQEITDEMCEAGMSKIARQEFNNIKDLCKDLGYYIESNENE